MMVVVNGYFEKGRGAGVCYRLCRSFRQEGWELSPCRILASNKMLLLVQHKFLTLSFGIYGSCRAWKELIVINLFP